MISFKSSSLSFFLAFTVNSTLLEISVAQGDFSCLQFVSHMNECKDRHSFIWLISLPCSLILLHHAFETLSNFQAAVTEEILWLLKLCQLPLNHSHNSNTAQTNTTFMGKKRLIIQYFIAITSFILPSLPLLRMPRKKNWS